MKVSFSVPASRATLSAALEGLTAVNYCILASKGFPPLYKSGVKYKRERPGKENWLNASDVLRAGYGDCEDLAAWRAAEWRLIGVPARAVVIRVGRKLFHAVVQMPDGTYEDPSKRLGMKGKG